MKKRLAAMLLAMVSILSMSFAVVHADTPNNAPQVAVNSIKVEFPDGQPFIDANNRTMIPVRFVAEKLGAKVDWDPATSTVLIDKEGIHIDMPIGSKTFTVTKNGQQSTVTMDTEAIIASGNRTYVPIRYVAEELGAFVDWASYYRIVDIVLPEGDLTAADIQRLRSYGTKQIFSDKQVEPFAIRALYDNFTFANAHYYAITSPTTPIDYYDTGYKVGAPYKLEAGSTSFSFAQMVMDCAHGYLENKESMGTIANAEKNTVDYKLLTDFSLVYRQKGPDFNGYAVRGVLTVKFNLDNELAHGLWEDFGIDEPFKTGKTYTVDFECVFGINGNGSFMSTRDYVLHEDGTVTNMFHIL